MFVTVFFFFVWSFHVLPLSFKDILCYSLSLWRECCWHELWLWIHESKQGVAIWWFCGFCTHLQCQWHGTSCFIDHGLDNSIWSFRLAKDTAWYYADKESELLTWRVEFWKRTSFSFTLNRFFLAKSKRQNVLQDEAISFYKTLAKKVGCEDPKDQIACLRQLPHEADPSPEKGSRYDATGKTWQSIVCECVW